MRAAILFSIFIVGNAITVQHLEETIYNFTKHTREKWNVDKTLTNMDLEVIYDDKVLRMVFTDPNDIYNNALVNEFEFHQFDDFCQQYGNETEKIFKRDSSTINFKLTCHMTPEYIKLWRTAIVGLFIISYVGFVCTFANIIDKRRNPGGVDNKRQLRKKQ